MISGIKILNLYRRAGGSFKARDPIGQPCLGGSTFQPPHDQGLLGIVTLALGAGNENVKIMGQRELILTVVPIEVKLSSNCQGGEISPRAVIASHLSIAAPIQLRRKHYGCEYFLDSQRGLGIVRRVGRP